MYEGIAVVADVLGICLLAFALYFPRHRRRDMLFAYVGLNVGVLAVTMALGSATVGAGLGLGLFGVLSIIRLRSSELTQAEVAYYFVSLAMGLVGGLILEPRWLAPALIVLLLAAVFVADHPGLFRQYRQQVITLDAAYTDESNLAERLGELLGADVKHMEIERIDLVRDTTVVDVRYRLRSAGEQRGRGLALTGSPPADGVRDGRR